MRSLPFPPPRMGWGSRGAGPQRGQSLFRHLALLCFDRLLGGRIYPPRIEADRVFGRDGRAAVLVPIRHTKRCDVVVRDHVIPVLQYSVESAGVSNEAGPI